MYSSLQRLNTVFATSLTALFVLLGGLALVGDFYLPRQIPVEVSVEEVQVLNGRYDSVYGSGGNRGDYAFLRFNIDADLTPLWNWNTKQIFVNVIAQYESSKYTLNQVSLWDRIIRHKQDAHVVATEENVYPFVDQSLTFKRDQPFNLTIQWNVVPWVGFFRMWGQDPDSAFVSYLPTATSGKKKK